MEQKTLILYLAGYNGHNSQKFQVIKNFFENSCVECRQFDQTLDFELDKIELEKIVDGRTVKLIASSLGCLSALWLHFKYRFEIVLINPSFFPEETLKDSLSDVEIENIRRFKKEIYEMRYGKYLRVFVAEDDERVDYKRFLDVFDSWIFKTTISPYGGHSFTAIREYVPFMNLWLFRKENGPEDWPQSYEAKEWGFLPPYEEFLEGSDEYIKEKRYGTEPLRSQKPSEGS